MAPTSPENVHKGLEIEFVVFPERGPSDRLGSDPPNRLDNEPANDHAAHALKSEPADVTDTPPAISLGNDLADNLDSKPVGLLGSEPAEVQDSQPADILDSEPADIRNSEPAQVLDSGSTGGLPIYRDLPLPEEGKCIRLLTIQDTDPSQPDGGPLRGSLSVADLADTPLFTALSYVWGKQASGHDPIPFVICNGASVTLTPNCHSALTHLRRRLGEFTIWVDAICINQNNEDERFQQIPLMGEIYSRAAASYMWLGEGTDETDRAMAWLDSPEAGFLEYMFENGDPGGQILAEPRVWAAVCSAVFSMTSCLPYNYEEPFYFRVLRRTRSNLKSTYTTYDDLESLLTRQWTTRIWTYQEIMLSQNPIIICGNAQIHWSRLVLSILSLSDTTTENMNDTSHGCFQHAKRWNRVALSRRRLRAERDRLPTSSIPSRGADDQATTNPPELMDPSHYEYFLYQVLIRIVRLVRLVSTFICLLVVVVLVLLPIIANNRTTQYSRIVIAVSYLAILSIWSFYITFCLTQRFRRILQHVRGWKSWKLNIERDTVDDFAEAIISRNSENPKDKAFGLYSVFAIKLQRNLPPADKTISLGEIYQELTLLTLDATDDLKPVLMAAGNGMLNQPSWVPNWYATPDDFWMQPFPDVPPPFSYFTRGTTGIALQHLSTSKAAWSLDRDNTDILTIGGYYYCTIAESFGFTITKYPYSKAEREVHENNLRQLRPLVLSHSPLHRNVFITTKRQDAESFTILLSDHLLYYWLFQYLFFRMSPAAVLRLMEFTCWGTTSWFRYVRNIVRACTWALIIVSWSLLATAAALLSPRTVIPSPFVRPNLLRIHIHICNDLASSNRMVFHGTSPDENGKRRSVGICTTEVEVGDKVIITSGLPSAIIIRPHLNSYRLVSPAVILDDFQKELKKRLDRSGKEKMEDILEYFPLV